MAREAAIFSGRWSINRAGPGIEAAGIAIEQRRSLPRARRSRQKLRIHETHELEQWRRFAIIGKFHSSCIEGFSIKRSPQRLVVKQTFPANLR